MDDDYSNFDTSNITFINTLWIVREPDFIIGRISLFLPLVVLGLIGNTQVIYIITKNVHLQTPTNLLIANMAVADLLSLLFHPWVFLTYEIFQNYQLGLIGCHGEGALECAIVLTSVFSMSAVTYDRLTAIVLPKETRLNKKGAKITMALTWIIGISISIPLGAYRHYRERQWLNFLEKYCKEKTVIINIYWYVIITVLIGIPLIIQIICYAAIFIKLKKYERKCLQKFNHRQVGYKKKAAIMMFIVTLAFFICHLPFMAFVIYRRELLKAQVLSQDNLVLQNQVEGGYHGLWFTSKFMIFVNAALNPIIYSWTNENYRKALRKTHLGRWLFYNQKQNILVVNKTVETKPKIHIFQIFRKKHDTLPYVFTNHTPVDTATKIINVKI